MQAVELLPAGEALPEHVIARWVAAALAEAKAWRDLDDQLYPADDDPARLERARQLHAIWRQWADQTGALLERIAAYNSPAQLRPDVSELRQENAWARALVRRTPEMILQRLKNARQGNVLTIEEARRELRTHHQPS
jgi:hypothetical protein